MTTPRPHNAVPDKRSHRGPHPQDARLFAAEMLPRLQTATGELAWLLDRGYAVASSLKLVGDRHDLTRRQRVAVARCASSTQAVRERQQRRVEPAQARDQEIWIDGYNVLTTIEAALGGGVLLLGRDGCCRDMASMHGSYRKVAETGPALELLGRVLESWGVAECRWWFDRPVSNSGRLKTMLLNLAASHAWPWRVELVPDPDAILAGTSHIVATADSVVLDRCGPWINLAREALAAELPGAPIIDLSGG